MNQEKYIEFIFSDIESMLLTKGDKMLLSAIKEELSKDSFEQTLAEFFNGCWADLDGRIVVHLDEWLESDSDEVCLGKLFDQNRTLHIEGEQISKGLWDEQIIDFIRNGVDVIKKWHEGTKTTIS